MKAYQKDYIQLCEGRLSENANMFSDTNQIAVQDDARNIPLYFEEEAISLIWTSPPYANLLNRKRKNEQLGKVEQYSQDERDLGTLKLDEYTNSMGIFMKNFYRYFGQKVTV